MSGDTDALNRRRFVRSVSSSFAFSFGVFLTEGRGKRTLVFSHMLKGKATWAKRKNFSLYIRVEKYPETNAVI